MVGSPVSYSAKVVSFPNSSDTTMRSMRLTSAARVIASAFRKIYQRTMEAIRRPPFPGRSASR